MGADCIFHCNKVSKPVKGKYLLLYMNTVVSLLCISCELYILFHIL